MLEKPPHKFNTRGKTTLEKLTLKNREGHFSVILTYKGLCG